MTPEEEIHLLKTEISTLKEQLEESKTELANYGELHVEHTPQYRSLLEELKVAQANHSLYRIETFKLQEEKKKYLEMYTIAEECRRNTEARNDSISKKINQLAGQIDEYMSKRAEMSKIQNLSSQWSPFLETFEPESFMIYANKVITTKDLAGEWQILRTNVQEYDGTQEMTTTYVRKVERDPSITYTSYGAYLKNDSITANSWTAWNPGTTID